MKRHVMLIVNCWHFEQEKSKSSSVDADDLAYMKEIRGGFGINHL